MRQGREVLVRIIALCSIVTVAFEAVASTIAHITGIAYAWFVIPQFAMYFVMGFILLRAAKLPVRGVMGVVTCAAFANATLGWWVSWQVGPGRVTPFTLPSAIFAIVLGVAACALSATLGTVAAQLFRARGQPSVRSSRPNP
jgi:hypothetical protein